MSEQTPSIEDLKTGLAELMAPLFPAEDEDEDPGDYAEYRADNPLEVPCG